MDKPEKEHKQLLPWNTNLNNLFHNFGKLYREGFFDC